MPQRHVSPLMAIAFPQRARFVPRCGIAQKRRRISEPKNVSIHEEHWLFFRLGHNRGKLQAIGAFAGVVGQLRKTSRRSRLQISCRVSTVIGAGHQAKTSANSSAVQLPSETTVISGNEFHERYNENRLSLQHQPVRAIDTLRDSRSSQSVWLAEDESASAKGSFARSRPTAQRHSSR